MAKRDLPRDLMPSTYQRIVSHNLNVLKRQTKICVFDNDHCTKVCNAHSVPEFALRRIAFEGKVKHFRTDIAVSAMNLPQYRYCIIEDLTIGSALPFPGLCRFHDKKAFSPIEDRILLPDSIQNSRLYFRALALSYYSNLVLPRLLRELVNVNIPASVLNPKGNEYIKRQIPLQDDTRLELAMLLKRKVIEIESGKEESLRYVMIRIDQIPDIMCCSLHVPFLDFRGHDLLPFINQTRAIEHCSITISADSSGGYIHLAWPAGMKMVDEFVASWISVDCDINMLIVKIITGNDNYVFSDKWWKSLSVIKKKTMMEYYAGYYMMLHGRVTWFENQKRFLSDWRKYVNWRIVNIETG